VSPDAIGLKETDEEVELHAEKNIEQNEHALHDQADALRMVGCGAEHLLVANRIGFAREPVRQVRQGHYFAMNMIRHEYSVEEITAFHS
jgi:hypothetical protein